MCLVLVLMLTGSGALMLLSYRPFPDTAYNSILDLETLFVFGCFVRSIHYFGANILVILVCCHMLRVFFTQGYTGPRQWNWIMGLFILSLVLLSCFTGYLLPWDQTAFWAVTICINLMDYLPAGQFFKSAVTSGSQIGDKTLHLFFTLHTTLIPALVFPFLVVHFWKIRKAKGVVTSGAGRLNPEKKTVMVDTETNLLPREAVTALVIIALVMVLSFFFKAPLGEMANAGLSPNPAKAPWYFAGFQELLLHFHPFFAVFIIPSLVMLFMVCLPFIPWQIKNQGTWFISKSGAKTAGLAVIFSFVLTLGLVLADEYGFNFFPGLTRLPKEISTGLFPFLFVSALIFGLHIIMKIRFKLTWTETFQALISFLFTSYVVLTLICVWFRATGMKLCFGGG